jgi:ubiquinone/menaquinone biosynthesis C-methylase UbiE
VAGAVDALGLRDGETAAHIGFGGGTGLALLLDRVGEQGTVHGVDISETILARARSHDMAISKGHRFGIEFADAFPQEPVIVGEVHRDDRCGSELTT